MNDALRNICATKIEHLWLLVLKVENRNVADKGA
jgi:hypothetical protein